MLKIWHPLQQPRRINKLSKGIGSGYYRSNGGTSCLPFLSLKKTLTHKWKNTGQIFKQARHVACLNYTYMQVHANASFPRSCAWTASTFSSNASLSVTGHTWAASPACQKSEHGQAGGNRGNTCIPPQHKRSQNSDDWKKPSWRQRSGCRDSAEMRGLDLTLGRGEPRAWCFCTFYCARPGRKRKSQIKISKHFQLLLQSVAEWVNPADDSSAPIKACCC